MTYPDPTVRAALAARFVALNLDHQTDAARRLRVIWLPTLFVVDHRGTVHYHSVNSVPPADFLDVLDLGEAHARLREGRTRTYARAEQVLGEALARRPSGPLTPELLYWHGIARYFAGHHDHAARDATWQRLREEYPDSIWTHRIP